MKPTAPSQSLQRTITTSTFRGHADTTLDGPSPTKHAPRRVSSNVPSDGDLLLRTLRLLNFDLLPDWPDVKASAFNDGVQSSETQRDRIRTAEWVLYRLFERWSPRETKTKLGSLFPALEPRQSIKLRAALLQWLTEMKHQGLLGRECMFRKSTLDECKGEKFGEVLLHLSTAVLQKVVRERNSNLGKISAVQELCLKNGWSAAEESAIGVLLPAYEASTRRSLQERNARRRKLSTLSADISTKKASLQEEQGQINREFRAQQSALQMANVDAQAIKKRLRQRTQEDTRWLNLAISGDVEHGRNATIEDRFQKVWSNAMNTEERVPYESIPSGLLANFERRVELQQERLARWRDFQKELSRRNEDLIVAQSPVKAPLKSPLKKFSSPQKTTPRRAASTRKPDRVASVESMSTRLQSLQMAQDRPPATTAKPNKAAEARGFAGPLQPPLDLQRAPSLLESCEGAEALCSEMAEVHLSSDSPASPSRRPFTQPKQQRTRLPSPSKSPGKQSRFPSHRPSHDSMQAPTPDNAFPDVLSSRKSAAQQDDTDEATKVNSEESLSTPPKPVETLTERTARTMAKWQQQAPITQTGGKASHCRTGSSVTTSPHNHKYTRSIPIASTSRGSSEPVVTDTMIQTQARSHRLDGSTDHEDSRGRPPLCNAASVKRGPSNLEASSSAVYHDPIPGDDDGHGPFASPPTKAGQHEPDKPTVDDESPFKPRNRLRRTPPGSPSPWDATEDRDDYDH